MKAAPISERIRVDMPGIRGVLMRVSATMLVVTGMMAAIAAYE